MEDTINQFSKSLRNSGEKLPGKRSKDVYMKEILYYIVYTYLHVYSRFLGVLPEVLRLTLGSGVGRLDGEK
jgi:hypothetical protein